MFFSTHIALKSSITCRTEWLFCMGPLKITSSKFGEERQEKLHSGADSAQYVVAEIYQIDCTK